MEEFMRNASQRLAILDATLRLAEDKPFPQLKVADVCTEAKISRSTFYRSFSGMSQIPIWYEEYAATTTLYQIGLTLTCRQGYMLAIRLIQHADPIYRSIANWWTSWNDEYSLHCISGHSQAIIEMLKARGVPITDRAQYEARAVAVAAHELVALWIDNDNRMPLEDLVDIICSFVPDHLLKIFNSPPEPADMALLIDKLL